MELLGRLRDGDEEAFVMLVGRYHQPMLRVARSMVSSEAVAEEAVQDTWLAVVRGIERFEGRSSFKTWLFHILANRVRSAATREQRSAPVESPHAVDPARFDAHGQWADPLERWAAFPKTAWKPHCGHRSSRRPWRVFHRVSARSWFSATWRG